MVFQEVNHQSLKCVQAYRGSSYAKLKSLEEEERESAPARTPLRLHNGANDVIGVVVGDFGTSESDLSPSHVSAVILPSLLLQSDPHNGSPDNGSIRLFVWALAGPILVLK